MNTRILLVGAASVAMLAACNQTDQTDPADAAPETAATPAESANAPGAASSAVGTYVPAAAIGDMYEIMAADIALERSENAQVRELAQMIKTDHTAGSERFKTIAPQDAPGVAIPTALDQRHQGLIDALRSADAARFDQVYLEQQVAAHQEAVTLHRGFSTNSEAPRLAEHSRTVLPKIEGHLQMAQRLAAS